MLILQLLCTERIVFLDINIVIDFEEAPHDDVMTGKRFPYYSPFVRGIDQSTADYPHYGPAKLMFSLLLDWPSYGNGRVAGDMTLMGRRCNGITLVVVLLAN